MKQNYVTVTLYIVATQSFSSCCDACGIASLSAIAEIVLLTEVNGLHTANYVNVRNDEVRRITKPPI